MKKMENIKPTELFLFNHEFYIERVITQRQHFVLKPLIKNINNLNNFDMQSELETETEKPVYNLYHKKTKVCVLKNIGEREIENFIKHRMEKFLSYHEKIVEFNKHYFIKIENTKTLTRTLNDINDKLLFNYELTEYEDYYEQNNLYSPHEFEKTAVAYVYNKKTGELVAEFDEDWKLCDFVLDDTKLYTN